MNEANRQQMLEKARRRVEAAIDLLKQADAEVTKLKEGDVDASEFDKGAYVTIHGEITNAIMSSASAQTCLLYFQ